MSGSAHLRGIVIAGGLAVLALVLGFFSLGMNQPSSSAAPATTIVPLKDRRPASARPAHTVAAKTVPATKARAVTRRAPRRAPIDVHLAAALKLGLPRTVARALAERPVAVVALTSHEDQIDQMAAAEARAGAALAGASYVAVSVDTDGAAATLTRVLGALPSAPASLVYERPGTLYTTLVGFNDRTTIQQAAATALAAYAAANEKPLAAASTGTHAAAAAPKLSWRQRANALCRGVAARLSTLVASPAPAAARAQSEYEAVSARFLSSLAAVRAQPDEAASVARLNALLRRYLAAGDEELAAAIRKDAPGVAAATARLRVLRAEIAPLERKLGVADCARATA